MKFYYTFFFLFLFLCCSSQEIIDKGSFKKCRKEFSKKICLSDEDRDGVLFYLDQCPKDAGPVENNGCPWPDTDGDGIIDKDDACPTVPGPSENNGCPWPDTDGDGILDKDDACPTIPGVAENNGCPSQKLDCTKFYEEEKSKFEKFREDNLKIENIYNKLTSNLLKYFIEKNKSIKVDQVYIKFLDYGPSCLYYPRNYVPTCKSSRSTDEYNFLVTKFWNNKALEMFSQKNNVVISIKYLFKEYDSGYSAILSEELHNYLKINSWGDRSYIFPKGQNKVKPNAVTIGIDIRFLNPYVLEITYTPHSGGLYGITKKLEYSKGKWNELKINN